MKMSRRGIVTSGRRPARPDGMYYRESRRRRVGRGGAGRGAGAVGLFLFAVVLGVAAYMYFF